MSPAHQRTPCDAAPELRVRLAVGVAVVGALVVLYFTLFPFDFVDRGRSLSEIVERFSLGASRPWEPRQVPANILLFVPLGFGLGGLIRLRTSSTWKTVLGTSMCVLAVSAGVELTQSAWLLRDPAVDDIVANTAGGALGAWLWTRSGSWIGAISGRLTSGPPRPARRLVWLIPGLLPAVLLSAVTFSHRNDSELAGWDRRFPLALGNEPTGDRPWRGALARVAVADRAFPADEIADLLKGAPMREIAPGSTLVDHSFRRDPAVPTGWRLRSTGSAGSAFSADGLDLGPERWLETNASDGISRRIDAANSFTVLLDATTASPTQGGPARLLSISRDPRHTNLTIAQQGDDLVVRVRTAFTGNNGISPEFVLPGAFRNDPSRRFVVTYRPSEIKVTMDHPAETSSIALMPETVPLVATSTDEVSHLRFSGSGSTFRQLIFAAIMFAPWAVCVTLLASRQPRRFGQILALVVVPIAVVELFIAWTVPGHPSIVGFVVTAAAALLFDVVALRRPLGITAGGSLRRSRCR